MASPLLIHRPDDPVFLPIRQRPFAFACPALPSSPLFGVCVGALCCQGVKFLITP